MNDESGNGNFGKLKGVEVENEMMENKEHINEKEHKIKKVVDKNEKKRDVQRGAKKT